MALFNKGTNILAIEVDKGICIFDLDFKYIRSVNPNDCLKRPSGICVNVNDNDEEITFVSDYEARKVFMFNSSFKLVKTIGNDLSNVNFLSVDYTNLYISHYLDDIVSVFKHNDGQLVTKIKVEIPFHSTNYFDNVYIVSVVDGESDDDKIKLDKIKKGNYINIISKLNFNIIKKIQFDNWLCPYSIYLPNDDNIYTTAHELDNNKIYSENSYIFKINKENNQIINKIELNDIEFFIDILYLNNKIILCGVNYNWNEIRIIEFY
jgi:hypothetical protein